ncbi:MAG: MerR family DNA-binding transcriptional regulator [Pseudolabrys sp.]
MMRHDIRLPSGSNIFWAENPNATAPAGRKIKIHASRCRELCRPGMDNEYRAHAPDGMDRADASPGAPRGRAGRIVLPLGELAHESGVTLRTLRFYQSKGLLAPQHNGRATEIRWPRVRTAAPSRSTARSVLTRSRCWSASGAILTGRWPSCDRFTPTYPLYRMSGLPRIRTDLSRATAPRVPTALIHV